MGIPNGLVPYNAAFLGAEIFTQSAWNDTRDNSVKLSAASSGTVPALGGIQSDADAKRKACYYYSTTRATPSFHS